VTTRTGEIVNDLSKGVLPVTAIIGILGMLWLAAGWVERTSGSTGQTAEAVKMLTQRVDVLTTQMQTLNLSFAQGPKLPENIIYRSDLMEFCLLNPNLKCPYRNR
jgi:hypothetical protein